MATKKLQTVALNISLSSGSVTGSANGSFSVEDVATCIEVVQIESDTSITEAKALLIAQAEDGGHTVVDETS